MSKHKHHIIPVYHCKELGIDPDFDENYVMVERLDHARIHWGYKCDDLEPLFEYITPAQWIIDLIPRGDNRDVGAAVLTAKGELDEIDMSGDNHHFYGKKRPEHSKRMSGENSPRWKGGISYDKKAYQQTPQHKAYRAKPENKALHKAYQQTPKYKAYKKKYDAECYAKKKAETQGDGTLEAFLK